MRDEITNTKTLLEILKLFSGRNWTGTLALYLISFFTVKTCDLSLIKSNTTLFETKNNFTMLVESAEKNKCSSTLHIRVKLKHCLLSIFLFKSYLKKLKDCGKAGGACVTTYESLSLVIFYIFILVRSIGDKEKSPRGW